MNQFVKENRVENFSPIYKECKQDLKSVFEADNLLSQMLASNKNRPIYCNSLFAEETINIIVGYFNEQSCFNNNFKNNVLNEIKNIEFAYPADNKKLEASVVINSENSFATSLNGMRNILEDFIRCSDFEAHAVNTYFEDIDYIIVPESEVYNSSKVWVEQTIDDPWFE